MARQSAGVFKLCTSLINCRNSTFVDITATGDGTIGAPSRLAIAADSGATLCQLSGQINIGNLTANDQFTAKIFKNGLATFDGVPINRRDSSTTSPVVPVESQIMPCVEGDYFELTVDSGADTDFTVRASPATFFVLQVIETDRSGTPSQVGIVGVTQLALNGAATISDVTATNIDWDQEISDTHGTHDNVTNPDRINKPTGVAVTHFTAHANVSWATDADGWRKLLFRIDDAAFEGMAFSRMSAVDVSSTGQQAYQELMAIADSEYIVAEVEHAAGGNLDINDSQTTSLIIVWYNLPHLP